MKPRWNTALFPALLLPWLLAANAPAPAPAQDLLRVASETARAGNKAVLVLFHASWCGWCRRLEGFLSAPEVRPVIERHYEVVWLTVQERGERRATENPGAAELLSALTGGMGSGLPFFAALGPDRKPLATSLIAPEKGARPENLGYPGTPVEIDAFVDLIRRTAPRITPSELETIRKGLIERQPKKI